MTLIEWKSETHRWAVIRIFDNPSDSDWVSQHRSPREALLRCQERIQGDPWTFPDGDTLSHYYDVEARNRAAALDLALARRLVAAEDAAAGRVSRYPRFDEPGGKLLTPGADDERGETAAVVVQFEDAVRVRRRGFRPRRRGNRDGTGDSGFARR